jgi:hypothetical protein
MIIVEWESPEAFASYRNDPRWPTCTRTARTVPISTSGTCAID